MLQGQIYAVVFKDAVVFAQIIIAEADWIIIAAYDGEFHFRVSHQVTALLSVMGDADDFSVPRKSSDFFDDNGHESRIVVDFGMAPAITLREQSVTFSITSRMSEVKSPVLSEIFTSRARPLVKIEGIRHRK